MARSYSSSRANCSTVSYTGFSSLQVSYRKMASVREKPFRPGESDLVGSSKHSGKPIDLPLKTLGVDFEVVDGYVRTVFYSDSTQISISCAQDVLNWFLREEVVFTSVISWSDAMLKWFGEGILQCIVDSVSGYPIRIGKVRIKKYRDSMVVYAGVYAVKRVYSIRPFYHMSDMLGEEDCYTTAAKAQTLLRTVRSYKLEPTSLYSSGGILQGLLVQNNVKMVSRDDTPKEVLELATNCYHAGWVGAYKLGSTKAWDYDISSAYPYEASELVSVDKFCGKWVQTPQMVPGAEYGWIYGKIKIIAPVSPVLLRLVSNWVVGKHKLGRQVNAYGEWEGWIEGEEAAFIISNKLGKVDIYDAYWFMPSVYRYPFRKSMEKVFRMRDDAKKRGDKFASNLCKLIGVTLQGKLISSFAENGKQYGGFMRHSVYAAKIVSRARLKLARFALGHEEHLWNVLVDGMTFDEYIETTDSGPGAIRLTSSREGETCIVAGDGMYSMPSRRSVFNRSIVETFGNNTYMKVPMTTGPYTLLEAASDRIKFEDVGKPRGELMTYRLSSLDYANRDFVRQPKTCKELLDGQFNSMPRLV